MSDEIGNKVLEMILNILNNYDINSIIKEYKEVMVEEKSNKQKQELAKSVIQSTNTSVMSTIKKNAKIIGVDEVVLLCEVLLNILSQITIQNKEE